ncbi:unnamed protein product [Schistocephalus solidus]|uniref:Uncharacterized protein n=1 Tax=Schistocephalus solidus TaxID=70667 RepID=A0A183T4Z1_SCHSO|nr:unnamed protein product [Schistocephalus solidus]
MSTSGETARPTTVQTAGEALDLSLNATTTTTAIQNQSTPNEMLRGQEDGSLPRLSTDSASPTGSALCPGFNQDFDYVDSSWLTLNPFLARSFAQNLSTVQTQYASSAPDPVSGLLDYHLKLICAEVTVPAPPFCGAYGEHRWTAKVELTVDALLPGCLVALSVLLH